MLCIPCSVWAVTSPTPTDAEVSRSWPTWPRRNTVSLATTAWHRSLSRCCSGYVSRVLNGRIRVWLIDSPWMRVGAGRRAPGDDRLDHDLLADGQAQLLGMGDVEDRQIAAL